MTGPRIRCCAVLRLRLVHRETLVVVPEPEQHLDLRCAGRQREHLDVLHRLPHRPLLERKRPEDGRRSPASGRCAHPRGERRSAIRLESPCRLEPVGETDRVLPAIVAAALDPGAEVPDGPAPPRPWPHPTGSVRADAGARARGRGPACSSRQAGTSRPRRGSSVEGKSRTPGTLLARRARAGTRIAMPVSVHVRFEARGWLRARSCSRDLDGRSGRRTTGFRFPGLPPRLLELGRRAGSRLGPLRCDPLRVGRAVLEAAPALVLPGEALRLSRGREIRITPPTRLPGRWRSAVAAAARRVRRSPPGVPRWSVWRARRGHGLPARGVQPRARARTGLRRPGQRRRGLAPASRARARFSRSHRVKDLGSRNPDALQRSLAPLRPPSVRRRSPRGGSLARCTTGGPRPKRKRPSTRKRQGRGPRRSVPRTRVTPEEAPGGAPASRLRPPPNRVGKPEGSARGAHSADRRQAPLAPPAAASDGGAG
jgi:hypothetical protein